METIRQQLTTTLNHMSEVEVKKIWDIIQIIMPNKTIPVVQPDEMDLAMIEEIKTNPDCKEYVSGVDAYAELGWD